MDTNKTDNAARELASGHQPGAGVAHQRPARHAQPAGVAAIGEEGARTANQGHGAAASTSPLPATPATATEVSAMPATATATMLGASADQGAAGSAGADHAAVSENAASPQSAARADTSSTVPASGNNASGAGASGAAAQPAPATVAAAPSGATGPIKERGAARAHAKKPVAPVRNNVRKIRTEKMMSKAELARRAGMSTLTIDRVERGFPCRMDTKRKILEALGLKPSDRALVFGDDEED